MKKFLVLIALLALLIGGSVYADAGVITVGCPHSTATTIQAGVTAANPGDEVLVCPGIYAGGILVEKPGIQLRALGPLGTVRIVGAGASRQLFGIAVIADDVRIEGFEIYGFAGVQNASGIFVGGTFFGDTAHPAGWAIIEHNKIHDNGNGIYLWHSNNNRISHNKIYNNKDIDGTLSDVVVFPPRSSSEIGLQSLRFAKSVEAQQTDLVPRNMKVSFPSNLADSNIVFDLNWNEAGTQTLKNNK